MTFLYLIILLNRSFKTKRIPHHYSPLFPTVTNQFREFRVKVKKNNPGIPFLDTFNKTAVLGPAGLGKIAYFLRIRGLSSNPYFSLSDIPGTSLLPEAYSRYRLQLPIAGRNLI